MTRQISRNTKLICSSDEVNQQIVGTLIGALVYLSILAKAQLVVGGTFERNPSKTARTLGDLACHGPFADLTLILEVRSLVIIVKLRSK
jgi:hypothetical protein